MFSTSCKSFGSLWNLTRQNFHKAAVRNTRSFCIMSQPLDRIPDVDIDANGVFKYVLIMVHDDESKQSKPIVRGYSRASWHAARRVAETAVRMKFARIKIKGMKFQGDQKDTTDTISSQAYPKILKEPSSSYVNLPG